MYGDPVLRKQAKEITKVDESIRKLAFDMLKTVKEAGGIGLAANQIGEEKKLFVIDRSFFSTSPGENSPLIVINPVLVQSHGEQTAEEGCLSIPGTYADVTRQCEVLVKGIDLDEKEIEIEGKGFLSRVLLHEIDHLNGLLFIDHLSSIRRRLLSKKLKKLSTR
ncbi:MAG: peptide deformylase [Candidatus Aminicenantes bacterium]|nr:peptide deformylase [Candidatus Aminicenantes bacterium]